MTVRKCISRQKVQGRPKFRELLFYRLSFRLLISIFQQPLTGLYFGNDDILLVKAESVYLVYEGISDSLPFVFAATSLGDDDRLCLTLDIHRPIASRVPIRAC